MSDASELVRLANEGHQELQYHTKVVEDWIKTWSMERGRCRKPENKQVQTSVVWLCNYWNCDENAVTYRLVMAPLFESMRGEK